MTDIIHAKAEHEPVPQFAAPPSASLSQRVLIVAASLKETRHTLLPLARTDSGRAAIERAIENLEGVVIRAVAGHPVREKKPNG